MLTANRRLAALNLCLAGMWTAWFTPFVLLVMPQARGRPLLLYAILFAVLVVWLLLLDLLNRAQIDSPRYELAVAGLIVLSTLASARLLIYADQTALDFHWLAALGSALFNLTAGIGSLLVVVFVNLFLWQRAASMTGSDVSFFSVGLSFRLGLLAMLFGGALAEAMLHEELSGLLLIYFGLGLLAVALARIEEKALRTHNVGRLLPLPRLAQLLAAVIATVGVAAALSRAYTRQGILALLHWLDPIWQVLLAVLEAVVFAVLWVLTPLLLWLEGALRWLFARADLTGLRQALDNLRFDQRLRGLEDQGATGVALPHWLATGLRYLVVLVLIGMALAFVLAFLDRFWLRLQASAAEDETAERLSFGGSALGRGWRRLLGFAHLVRRYGLRRELLAAISVENLYANLSRIASSRGFARRPAQPPDDYLPVLARAYVGQDEALSRITLAYMRVHYGDRPVTPSEMASLRRDYLAIRDAPGPREARRRARRSARIRS